MKTTGQDKISTKSLLRIQQFRGTSYIQKRRNLEKRLKQSITSSYRRAPR